MSYTENARKLRRIVESAMQSIDGNDALTAMNLYPKWEKDTAYTAGFKVKHNDKLWRCLSAHTSIVTWEPENAASLWEQVDETHTGIMNDPIQYSGNMALVAGLYYTQNEVIYLCIRDTVNPVYNALADLVGLYVEIA